MGARYHIVIHVLNIRSADTGKLQMSDAYNLMARANIGNFNRNRDLTRKLRNMRRKARKEWKQNLGNKAVRQARKKFNKQNKDAVKVGTVKIKTGTNTLFSVVVLVSFLQSVFSYCFVSKLRSAP